VVLTVQDMYAEAALTALSADLRVRRDTVHIDVGNPGQTKRRKCWGGGGGRGNGFSPSLLQK